MGLTHSGRVNKRESGKGTWSWMRVGEMVSVVVWLISVPRSHDEPGPLAGSDMWGIRTQYGRSLHNTCTVPL